MTTARRCRRDLVTDQHRERAVVPASGHRLTGELAAGRAATRRRRPRRRGACARRRGTGPARHRGRAPVARPSVFSTSIGDLHEGGRAVGPHGGDPDHAVDGFGRANSRTHDHAGRRGQDLLARRGGQRDRVLPWHAGTGSRCSASRSISCSTASSHGIHAVPSTSSVGDRLEAVPAARGPRARGAAPGGSGLVTLRRASEPGSTTTSVRTVARSEPVGRGVGRRREHAELPAHLVLLRRGAVRVEHVALVQHGVGHRPSRRRRIGRSSALLAGFLQQLLEGVVPGRQGAAALNRVSASSVSRRRAPSHCWGSSGPSSSRHTGTGSRKAASSCQATGRRGEPAGVAAGAEHRAREQQEERDLAVVQPCRYLAAATSKS